MMSDKEIETVTPEDAEGDMRDYEIVLDGKFHTVVMEIPIWDNGINCPTCNKINSKNKMYLLSNGQYLYKGVCCGMFGLCEVNGEDNGMATDN
tara:strand:- start:5081 stop:5359 length:279 start_codon:yes stop_codon:yes gene_type:complete